MSDTQQQLAAQIFFRFYEKTFDDLYRYCARRVSTKPVIAFMMKAFYEHALDEISRGNTVTILDLYQWAYEFLVVQQQPSTRGGSVKRINDFRDVYDVKTDSATRTIRREELLENFYTQLEYKEREVLWLTFFERLSDTDRARVMGIPQQECVNFFYEVLKKARQVVTMATAHHKGRDGFGALASYFGGVSSLLKKVREDESLTVDHEICASLRTVFSDQFARQGVAPENVPASSVRDEGSYTPVDISDILTSSWMSRMQGIVVLAIVVVVVVFGYRYFASPDARVARLLDDARVARLLDDARVSFADGFSPNEKTRVAREILLSLLHGRDFSAIAVRKVDGDIAVMIAREGGFVNEAFRLYPYTASFDFPFAWQPREYHRVLVSMKSRT